jgi:hypothetical protein
MNTKLKLAVLAVALVASTSALAYGGRGGYNGGYNGYRGGYNGGNGWGYAAAAIGGAIIGGAIANSYAQPAPQYYAPQPQFYNPYAPTAPIYSYPPPGVYVQPVQPRWHWEQQYDPSCNCVRDIQVMD